MGTGPAPARIAVVPEPDGPLPSRIDFIFHLLDRDGDPVLAREAHLDVPEDIADPATRPAAASRQCPPATSRRRRPSARARSAGQR
jgi:hypothetical protein